MKQVKNKNKRSLSTFTYWLRLGCDVINLSLGGPSNWAEDPTALIANRISEKGSIGKDIWGSLLL